MKKTTMEAMFNGRIAPINRDLDLVPEYRDLKKEADAEIEYFQDRLSVDDKARFERFCEQYFYTGVVAGREYFTYGLQLGLLLMVEAFATQKGLLTD